MEKANTLLQLLKPKGRIDGKAYKKLFFHISNLVDTEYSSKFKTIKGAQRELQIASKKICTIFMTILKFLKQDTLLKGHAFKKFLGKEKTV